MAALQALGLAVEGRIVALVSASPVDRAAIVRALAAKTPSPFSRLGKETTFFRTEQDAYTLFATATGNAAAAAMAVLVEDAFKAINQIPIKDDVQCAYTLGATLGTILHDGRPITTNSSRIETWIDSENIDTRCMQDNRFVSLRHPQLVKKPEIYIDILEIIDYRINLPSVLIDSPAPTPVSKSSCALPLQCEVNGEIIIAAPVGGVGKSKMSWRYANALPLAHESFNEDILIPLHNEYLITPPTYRTQICRYRHDNVPPKDLPYDLQAKMKVNGTEIIIDLAINPQYEYSKQNIINSERVELEFRLPSDVEKIKVVKGKGFTHDKDNAIGKWTLHQKCKGNLVLQVTRYLPKDEFKTEILLHYEIDGLSFRKMDYFIPADVGVVANGVIKWVKYLTKSGHCSYRISCNMAAAAL